MRSFDGLTGGATETSERWSLGFLRQHDSSFYCLDVNTISHLRISSERQYMYSFEDTSDWFWETIARADRDRERLAAILEQFSKEELIRFEYEFESTLFLAWRDVQARREVSDDGAIILCGWLVSQGRDYFADVLRNPEKIPELEDIEMFEDLSGVAGDVYLLEFEEFIPVPHGGYWGFLSDPWIDEIDNPEHESFLGDLAEGLSIHKEYVQRLSRKSDTYDK